MTWTLIGLNVLAYLATAFGRGGSPAANSNSELFKQWELFPLAIAQNHEFYRLLTSAFLHYGLVHLGLNMFALYVLGPGLERVLGSWRFLAVYGLSALGGSVAAFLFSPVLSATAGASGAIFGLFACALVISRVVGFDTRALIFTIGINFVFTFAVPGISKQGHVGGFIAGGLATVALLGWSLRSRPVTEQTARLQAIGLAGLFVVLVAATAWRVNDLQNYQLPAPVGAAASAESFTSAGSVGSVEGFATAGVVKPSLDGASPSSTVWTGLGRTTRV
jgi:membrane associated rhomboid family serine protease